MARKSAARGRFILRPYLLSESGFAMASIAYPEMFYVVPSNSIAAHSHSARYSNDLSKRDSS